MDTRGRSCWGGSRCKKSSDPEVRVGPAHLGGRREVMWLVHCERWQSGRRGGQRCGREGQTPWVL